MRDNFSSSTIAELRKRAGERCSNPKCGVQTSGPRLGSYKSITIGVASHIYAASPGGPRFTQHMSSAERTRIDNGIWLCQSCSKLIDSDEARYTPEILMGWRDNAEKLAFKNISERSLITEEAEVVDGGGMRAVREIIELGANNEFAGNNDDLINLATRCAIRAIDGKSVEFDIRLLATNLSVPPPDPLMLPKYEAARRKSAELLKKWMLAITSPQVYVWWKIYLGRVDDWQLVISTLLKRAQTYSEILDGNFNKVDVWRTSSPLLTSPIYISLEEVEVLLRHLGFESMQDLRFGPFWRSASDMPSAIIVKHVIPKIIIDLVQYDISPEGEVLNLAEWHIGQG